jgi:hypothetical protein
MKLSRKFDGGPASYTSDNITTFENASQLQQATCLVADRPQYQILEPTGEATHTGAWIPSVKSDTRV